MPRQQAPYTRRKLEELDVLGALDNIIELADLDSSDAQLTRLERARLRTTQTIAISLIIALSIILVLAFVMGLLREHWAAAPQASPAVQVAPQAPVAKQPGLLIPPPLTPQTAPGAQDPRQAAAAALALNMRQWEFTTTGTRITQLWPASRGGVFLATPEGQRYMRISQLAPDGKCTSQFSYESDGAAKFMALDSRGCSYFCEAQTVRKYDLSGQRQWEIEREERSDQLLTLPGGGSVLRGAILDAAHGCYSTIAALNDSGAQRWACKEPLFITDMQAGPDGSVYYLACPWGQKNQVSWDPPDREQQQLSRLSPSGALAWRCDLAFAKLNYYKPPLRFTPGGVLLLLPREAEGGARLLLISAANGKQLHSYTESGLEQYAPAPDGTVYVIERGGSRLRALDAALEPMWERGLLNAPARQPLIFPDSSVCICDYYRMRGLSSGGKLLYDIPLPDGTYSSEDGEPLAGDGGLIYVPRGGKLLAYRHRDWSVAQP